MKDGDDALGYEWPLVEIETTREMEELLDWLSLLTIVDQVEALLHRRIQHSFYFAAQLSPALDNSATGRIVVSGVERLIERGDVPEAAERVTASVKKALQFWRLLAGRSIDTIAEPIILFNGIEALSEALIHGTFLAESSALRRHGVRSEKDHREAVVSPDGLFALTHAACHIEPYLVCGTRWDFQELTSLNHQLYLEYQVAYGHTSPASKSQRLTDRWELENRAVQNDQESFYEFPCKVTTYGSQRVMLHPLDYRFLGAFVLSNLARYETKKWLNFLESREGFIARSFLTKTIRSYPNMFLNQFWGRLFLIGPQMRFGFNGPANLLD